jgi:hypothetical protein
MAIEAAVVAVAEVVVRVVVHTLTVALVLAQQVKDITVVTQTVLLTLVLAVGRSLFHLLEEQLVLLVVIT